MKVKILLYMSDCMGMHAKVDHYAMALEIIYKKLNKGIFFNEAQLSQESALNLL